MENLGENRRSAYCGHFNDTMEGQTVTAMGWVNRVRKLGQLVFITLRDHTGLVQLAFDENTNAELFAKAESLKSEYVISATGVVALRREKDINPDMATGKVEIIVDSVSTLSAAALTPFQVGDENVGEALRMKHRYLDLRRDALQNNLRIRSRAALAIRNFLAGKGFIEVETPILTNSAPEGARDYLVPSRVHPGKFYALPQSPQILKQILMVAGVDKYFQIAKCLRDEDLRADRQPEFTQVDIEQSFIDQEDIIALCEEMTSHVFKEVIDHQLQTPFLRLTYAEAMERFGSDKPDMRFGMEIRDISHIVAAFPFEPYANAISSGGSVRGILATGCGVYSRKQLDGLTDMAKTYKAKGLSFIQISPEGEVKTALSKFFDEGQIATIIQAFNAQNSDLIIICADSNNIVFDALGNLRLEVARRENLMAEGVFAPLWVVDFPLLEYDEEDGRYYACHHPFTAPKDEDLHLLDTPNAKDARAKTHDLVINGYETAGGSIRIHREDLQEKMLELLSYTKEEARANFGHLLEALKYGAPPHGGVAFGLDRLSMLLCGTNNIRDVIAFPKQQDGSCPMTNAPNTVFPQQLEELGLRIEPKKED